MPAWLAVVWVNKWQQIILRSGCTGHGIAGGGGGGGIYVYIYSASCIYIYIFIYQSTR